MIGSSGGAAADAVAAAKEQQRTMYSMGDYSYLSRLFAPSAEALVDGTGVSAQSRVVDVAAGDGNCAIAAARRGATVTATDITPMQVELGRQRTEREGLSVTWIEADAEALPFPDGEFDVVLSAFGFIYAPRPEVVVSEALRVLGSGGALGFTAWPPEGYVGRLNELADEYLAVTGDLHAHDPDSWGVEATVRARLEPHVSSLDLRRKRMYLRYDSMADYSRDREEKIPAQQYLKSVLAEEEWKSWVADNERIADEFDRAEGEGVRIEAEYLLVVARK